MNAVSKQPPPMGVLAREEESENEVRREDQDRINEFAKLNARKHEIRSERESIQVGTKKSEHIHTPCTKPRMN
jgi:hypothetical protein